MAIFFNVDAQNGVTELVSPLSNINVSSISLTNIQKVSKCKVDLFIENNNKRIYFLKQVELPRGVTLKHEINFNNSTSNLGLYIKLTDGDTFGLTGTIDVTGTNTNVPGTNTLYLSEVSVGDEVVVSGETRTVAEITSDTAMTVTSAWGSDLANDTTPDCNPTALVDVILR